MSLDFVDAAWPASQTLLWVDLQMEDTKEAQLDWPLFCMCLPLLMYLPSQVMGATLHCAAVRHKLKAAEPTWRRIGLCTVALPAKDLGHSKSCAGITKQGAVV